MTFSFKFYFNQETYGFIIYMRYFELAMWVYLTINLSNIHVLEIQQVQVQMQFLFLLFN